MCDRDALADRQPRRPFRDIRTRLPPLLDALSLESRIGKIAGLKVPEVQQFLRDLKSGVAAKDSKVICAMVSYPLSTTTSGTLKDMNECRARYARIFNQKVVEAIDRQRFETLFVNYQGVMIGRGEIWISGVCRDKKCERGYNLRIIRVNLCDTR